MQKIFVLGPLIFGLLSMSFAGAQSPKGYDAGAGRNVQPMSVEDYLVDKNTIKGTVAVKGSIGCMGADTCFLYGSNIMTSATFNAGKLSRDDRKRFLSCNAFSDPCIVTIIGQNHPTEMLSSIDATQAIWEPTEEDISSADPTLPPCDAVTRSDIKGIVENSPLAQMTHMSVVSIKLDTTTDKDGHLHCVATILTSGGEKKFRYHLKHQEKEIYITGQWIS